MSKSNNYLNTKSSIPKVTPNMAKSVSQYRKDLLEQQVENGQFSDGSINTRLSPASYVTAAITKKGQVASSGGGHKGSNDAPKMLPDQYSPLWLMSNMSLPRDKATINAWARSFFALNPYVHNAINLHSTYPISKLNIKCSNKEIEKFFQDMCEELDLINICVQIAQEYWLLGEAFPYAELDESTGKWSRIVLQNPDYISVKRTVLENEPLIMLKPDDNLKRIVTSNKSSDIEQRKQLNPYIVDCVRKGQNIPLDNFYVSMIARKIAPYELRGTGLVVPIFKSLMLFDKIRECYDEETEVLTESGFKKINELLEFTESYDNIVGICDNRKVKLKDNIKIASYDKDNDLIKFLKPKKFMISNYSGEMLHFKGNKVDIKVTPNHKMMVKSLKKVKSKALYGNYEDKKAEDLALQNNFFKFKSVAKFEDGITPDTIEILGKSIDTNFYLKLLGYIISEGCLFQNYKNNRYDNLLSICQATDSDCYFDMKESFNKFGEIIGVKVCNKIIKEKNRKEKWIGTIHNKDIVNFFIKEICSGGNNSYYKRIPREIFKYNKKSLEILLNSLIKGDGSEKKNKQSTAYTYCTVSKQLSDDVYELSYRCGYSPNMHIHDRKGRNEYYVLWSDTNYGSEPIVAPGARRRKSGGADVEKVNYNGVIWCFETDTGYFVTRRNNKITIQGNCKYTQADDFINPFLMFKVGGSDGSYKPSPQDLEAWRNIIEQMTYDKNFKLITHEAVTAEVVNKGSGIYDTNNDVERLIKEIYTGLMVPSVVMDGGSDTTYANGGVALDVLRQRYMTFRNLLASWLKRKIFLPISKIQDFYEYKDGKKVLIVPEVDWNHMSLFDTGEYIQTLKDLTQGSEGEKRVSNHELYRALGLDFEDQMRKIRKETIANTILIKEKEVLSSLTLNELRALTDDDEIQEKKDGTQEKLPGQTENGGLEDGGMPGMPGAPPMDLPDLGGAPPGMPEAGPSEPPK